MTDPYTATQAEMEEEYRRAGLDRKRAYQAYMRAINYHNRIRQTLNQMYPERIRGNSEVDFG